MKTETKDTNLNHSSLQTKSDLLSFLASKQEGEEEEIEEEEEVEWDEVAREGFEYATLRAYKEHYLNSLDKNYKEESNERVGLTIDYSYLKDSETREVHLDTNKIEGFAHIRKYAQNSFANSGLRWTIVPKFSSVSKLEKEDRDTILIIPFEKRRMLHSSDDDGTNTYFEQAFEYFARNRTTLDFHSIYTHSKRVVHWVLDSKSYSRHCKDDVDMLLRIYTDLEDKPILMHTLADEMLKLEKIFLEGIGSAPWHYMNEGFEENVFPLINEQIKEDMGNDVSSIIYMYSFWLRRYYEGNMDSVYRTLNDIQEDYAILSE